MAVEYSIEVCRELEERFRGAELHRPMRVSRFDAGTELTYDVTAVGRAPLEVTRRNGPTHPGSGLLTGRAGTAEVRLVVEKFVGGGFAGQVYKVRVLEITGQDGQIEGLEPGGVYAIKILIPPSGFSRLFRNMLYWVGFQGPFQLQVNPAAARAGGLWQKLIRRGAKIRFGDERAVIDIYATFVDEKLGGCGELREWVEGRTWQLEVDDRMDLLKRWRRKQKTENRRQKTEDTTTNHEPRTTSGGVGSPEYRAKYKFMADFVQLLHDMGGYEFARQYEWSTCKSQPNVLKRQGTDDEPSGGLVAVDFRAGLALLPFLPMSPGDFKLIANGFMRGSLVQFDRGDLKKLEGFIEAHGDEFADMGAMLEELKTAERIYRNSVPDITHNHIRLLYSGELWSTMLDIAVTGWQVRNLIDERHEPKLRYSKSLTILFFVIGLVPFLGKLVRRIWGRGDWRRHYAAMLTSGDYLRRAIRGRIAEKVTNWHRAGRVDGERAKAIAESFAKFFGHLPLSILPAGLHRLFTDLQFAKEKLRYIFVRPFKLYFSREVREQWLRDMVTEGQNKHMLSDKDAEVIISQLNEPFIQKYLKSLAVHICTLPVTQIVSVMIAIIFVLTHPEMPRKQAWGIGIGIIALFQVVPISPGSLVRGLYVLYLVIRERNFKDYNIAVFLGFFKYIGYLAFPIQMTYHYPVLARFMAGHWATEAVHIVPVFGERGALLEHWVFCLFYNWPLTIRRRMQKRAKLRASIKPRYWHAGLCAIATAAVLGSAEFIYLKSVGELPGLNLIWWWLAVIVPQVLVCGAMVTLAGGGTTLWKRIITATICGVTVGLLYTAATGTLGAGDFARDRLGDAAIGIKYLAEAGVWRIFVFAIISTTGAIAAELMGAETDLK